MDEIQLTPAQRNIFPFVLALIAAAVALVGLFTPWLSIGANGLSGSKSDQGTFTYLVILSSLILGLTAFVPQLKSHKKFIALLTGILSLEVLISYAIWAAQVLKAIKNFNTAADKLGNLGGLFGGALSNLANNLKPSITTGFYMVCAGAILGLVSSALIFRQTLNSGSDETLSAIETTSDEHGVKNKYFGVSQPQFILSVALAIVGLVLVIISAYSSSISDSVSSATGNSSNSNVAASASSDAFKCARVENVRNLIKLNQPSFSGDPEPTDIFVVTQFSITNNCDKPIIGIKGDVAFQDVVGDTVFTGNYTDDETIPVGTTLTTSSTTGWTFNEFEDQYGQLAGMDQSKTHAVMNLTKVAFGDGTSING